MIVLWVNGIKTLGIHLLLTHASSKVTAPQDAYGRLVLQVYLGSNTLEFSAICR